MLVLLSSCYDSGMYYPAGGYPAGSYGGYSATHYSSYGGVSPYGYRSWGGGPYYGYGGYGNYRCSRCRRNPCVCSGHQHHHHNSGSRSSSSNERKYRILAGDLGGKKKPNDFHSLDWYHDRGYSLEKLKIETNRGAVIDKRPSSQKSSSSSSRGSSSSSSRSKSSSSGSRSSSGSKSLGDHVRSEFSKKR